VHKLLKRQLNRYLPGADLEPLRKFLDAVSAAYDESDADRKLLERSIELTSQELVQRNSELKGDLAVQRQRMQAIVDNSPSIVYLVDRKGTLLLVNRLFESVFRVDRKEAVGKRLSEVLPQGYGPGAWERDHGLLDSSSAQEIEEEVPHADGERPHHSHKFPLLDPTGRAYALCTISTDISDRRNLEAGLLQAQKMDAIGRLAGGIAHDFNNLLTAILGYSGMLLDRKDLISDVRIELSEIRKAGTRAADLTRQLLAFSRKQNLQPQVVDLNSIVVNLEKMLRRLIHENIALTTLLDPELPRVKVDPGQMEQVILNLAVNARDAMPEGGTLTIETSSSDQVRGLPKEVQVPQGKYVVLSISDNGVGMSPEVQAHLFEPFFTTKPQGQGTGLGLSTVYGIVKQSNGFVTVSSRLGKGSRVEVFLPGILANAEPQSNGSVGPLSDRGSETILLVEDDELVRSLTQRVLESRGYRVLSASRGAEALKISESFPHPIHLLLIDVVMPDLNGIETAHRIRSRRPDSKILFVSGYTEAASFETIRGSREEFLQKPYQPEILAAKIRSLLRSSV
jgi:PAS domain S-box-containing protein